MPSGVDSKSDDKSSGGGDSGSGGDAAPAAPAKKVDWHELKAKEPTSSELVPVANVSVAPLPPPPPEDPEKAAERKEKEEEEGKPDDKFLANGKPRIRIESISPAHGPTTGDTKVVVRGGPFAQFQAEHPEPKCKFGDQTVGGAYVPCPPTQPKMYEKEGGRTARTAMCI